MRWAVSFFIVGLGVVPPSSALVTIPTFPSGPMHTQVPILKDITEHSTTAPLLPLVTIHKDGIVLIPPKLEKKILDLEYVEMSELIPDSSKNRPAAPTGVVEAGQGVQ